MFKSFISYYKPYKLIFFLDMLASFFVSAIAMVYPILTEYMIGDFIPNKKINFVILGGAILLILYLIRMYLKYFVQYYGHCMGVKMQADMRRDMFKKLEKLPFSFYDEHESGKIMSRMVNDLQVVSELAHHGPENIFICGFMVIGSFIYLAFLNWLLTLIIFACVPVLVFISLFMRKRMDEAFTKTRVETAVINANLESSISGIRVTKAYNNEEFEEMKFQKGNNSFVKARSKAYKRMGEFGASTNFVIDLFNVIILLVGGIFLYYEQIDFAEYSAFIVSINLFITPLTTLINFVETYQDGVTGFRRFYEIMNLADEEDNGSVTNIKLSGDISFQNVSFKYDTSKDILQDFSLDIKKGMKVALVGPSGGGKTTICHLLPNFYKITQGDILFDGKSIKEIANYDLRQNIGIVEQDVFLFNDTIKENIRYGKLEASDEEVFLAAKRAKIDLDIKNMPNGYDTVIGERGVKLSGGQKQRVSIARVFLKNPSILILDEATSALDNVTELAIEESLTELTKDRTTLVVAHRLSTIFNSDLICVIDNGKLQEAGNHEELLALNGIYKSLYESTIK